MSIKRIVKVAPEEIVLKVVVRRSSHPLLHAFIRENFGSTRTSFVRDTLEDVLAGRIGPREGQGAATPPPSSPAAESTQDAHAAPALTGSATEMQGTKPVEPDRPKSDAERIAEVLRGNAGFLN